MTLRAGDGFRFPNQKYDDSKALYTNFRYMQEYLNRIALRSKYGPTTIIGTTNTSDPSTNPSSAHVLCDGENDEVEINAALAEGGWVHLLDGTYVAGSSITTSAGGDRFRLTGSGIGSTIITGASGINIFSLAHGSSGTVNDVVSFEDFTVDGQSTAAIGFNQGSSVFRDVLFHKIHVKSCTSHGWNFDRTAATVLWNECLATDNGGNGFSQGEGQTYVTNCVAADNAGAGFLGGQQIGNCSITNSLFTGNNIGIQGSGGVSGTSNGPLILGCHIDGNTSHGISWSYLPGTESRGVIAIGNRIVDNGGTSLTSGSGVCVVVGNNIEGNGTDAPTVAAGSVVGLNTPLGAGFDLDHGSLSGLLDDDHTQYVLRSILTTDGDLFARGSGVVTRIGVGTDGQVLTVDTSETTKIKWADPTGGTGTGAGGQEFRKVFLLGGM